ncbi:unnamed protein product [Protopolystoma xenopodis]|uniref:Uncharacterized protein n=1 Tax=Protopolystoma xenopodis TaxID=117903 RepID=A0A3S5AJS2_9PLAT|nr:unnamed protein product [Protopolystoma xenopodis]
MRIPFFGGKVSLSLERPASSRPSVDNFFLCFSELAHLAIGNTKPRYAVFLERCDVLLQIEASSGRWYESANFSIQSAWSVSGGHRRDKSVLHEWRFHLPHNLCSSRPNERPTTWHHYSLVYNPPLFPHYSGQDVSDADSFAQVGELKFGTY